MENKFRHEFLIFDYSKKTISQPGAYPLPVTGNAGGARFRKDMHAGINFVSDHLLVAGLV